MIYWLLIVFYSFSWAREVANPGVVFENHLGQSLLFQNEPASSIEKFSNALAEAPELASLYLNIGLAFEQTGQPEKAMQSYQMAEKLARDPAIQFQAIFNQAQMLGKDKKIDEALLLYQKALELDPESIPVKTNIELLIQAQSQGGGKGKNDQNQKDQNGSNKGGNGQDSKDQKDQNKDQNENQKAQDKDQEQKNKDNENKKYAPDRSTPKSFKSDQLEESDVKKIFNEIKQQEQKIRAEFNKKGAKEKPRGKDW